MQIACKHSNFVLTGSNTFLECFFDGMNDWNVLSNVCVCMEFSVGKLREVARSFRIIFFKSKSFSVDLPPHLLLYFGRDFRLYHDPLGALDCNSNRVLPSFDHSTQNIIFVKVKKWLLK